MILSFFEEREKFILSHTLALSLTTLEASSHWCDGLLLRWRSFGFTWKESKIHHTRSNVLFFFHGGPSVSNRLCMCICLCLSSVSMYRNYNDTQQSDALIFKRSLANSSRTHSLSLCLSFAYAHIHSRRYGVGIMFILFLVLKISRSFLEKAFFPSSFGRCNL